jgi:hypothetical protein
MTSSSVSFAFICSPFVKTGFTIGKTIPNYTIFVFLGIDTKNDKFQVKGISNIFLTVVAQSRE